LKTFNDFLAKFSDFFSSLTRPDMKYILAKTVIFPRNQLENMAFFGEDTFSHKN